MPNSNSAAETILMVTVSCGGGHIQASKAKYNQIKVEAPKTRFYFCDIFVDVFGQKLGRFFAWQWNAAQENGNVGVQEWLRMYGFPIAEKLFWIPIFCKTLHTLATNKITKIIDTQILGTSAIIKAIQCIEFFFQRNISYEKVITELPSTHVKHFTNPIKKLSAKEKKYIKISCFFSGLIEEDRQEIFWQTLCGVSARDIIVDSPPLRPHFLELMETPTIREEITLKILAHSEQERELIESTAERGYAQLQPKETHLLLSIKPDEHVTLIMLGSRPHEKATLKYVSQYIQMVKEGVDLNELHLLFVFCRNYDESPHSLIKRVRTLVTFEHDFPKNLSIIPLPFQDDATIAPLFNRADLTITRSGGMTAMELLAVCNGKIRIHSENLTRISEKRGLGMPLWEEGNALYLVERKGAKFITPETFTSSIQSDKTSNIQEREIAPKAQHLLR